MGGWLQSLPEWEEILVLCGVVVISLGALAAIIVTVLNRGKVRISKAGVEIESAPVAGTRKKPKHAGCKNVSDIIIVLNKNQEIADRVFEIKYIETLREQMSFSDGKAIQIRGAMERPFIDVLASALKREGTSVEVLSHHDYRVYSLCLDKLHVQNTEFIKQSLRENHYLDITEVEFDVYVGNKIDTIFQMTTSLLNAAYFGDVIPRGMLYKLNLERVAVEVRTLLYDIFLNARRIAGEKKKRIDQLQKERDDFINMVLGVDGVNPIP